MGDIARWSHPDITADNNGLLLPDEPITVVYRGGQSGTTALFYDFVANAAPDLFAAWAGRYNLPTNTRIISLDGTPQFAPRTLALNGSDQIAQFVASSQGRWAIAYDEFGYAITYGATAARIQNQAGEWVLPYAENISAALESARLRPDLSQDLTGVYTSSNPLAYPISAYSYITTQCVASSDRPTCRGPYTNPGITETLALWMRYIACDGQVNMARIGYSPLPPNLSQEMANSIARMQGTEPEQLNAGNCANPRFRGSLGTGASSPPDPLAGTNLAGAGPAAAAAADAGAAGAEGAAAGAAAAAGADPAAAAEAAAAAAGAGAGAEGAAAADATTAEAGSGRAGSVIAVGGGSATWRASAPIAYDRPIPSGGSIAPVLLVLALLIVPPLVLGRFVRRRVLT
jgi:phosphate transport system substrate-binding protein